MRVLVEGRRGDGENGRARGRGMAARAVREVPAQVVPRRAPFRSYDLQGVKSPWA